MQVTTSTTKHEDSYDLVADIVIFVSVVLVVTCIYTALGVIVSGSHRRLSWLARRIEQPVANKYQSSIIYMEIFPSTPSSNVFPASAEAAILISETSFPLFVSQ